VIFPGERPLHALRERGVEYVEVRLLDLDPFAPLGIQAQTMRWLDIFLLHCLLAHSPPDSRDEIAEIGQNQHLTAARGRELGLQLHRQGQPVALLDWGSQILRECEPIAHALDAAQGGALHQEALAAAQASLLAPHTLPSARVLAAMADTHGNSFIEFTRERSLAARSELLGQTWTAQQQAAWLQRSQESVQAQKDIEAADTLPFEQYREQYVSPAGLGLRPVALQALATA